MTRPKKIVLAYSGGLDTSVILRWLRETYGAEIVAYTADLGQAEELIPIRDKALRTGASAVHVVDLREEFVRDFVFPVLRAGAVYEGGYLMGTSFARPLIAKAQVAVARAEGADAVAHGATGKGNDQVRFELTYAALAPELQVIAPWREWDLRSRTDLMAYAERHGIPVTTTPARPYSMDRNLFHISYEGGILEDPWAEPPEKMFLLTRSPEEAPDVPAYVDIDFEAGTPVAVDGEPLGPVALLERLNRLGGEHGVGRIDLVENRYVGMKSRGVYETPGGTILHAAHRALESITLDRELLHLRDSLVPRYAEMVYYGFWYAPEREALQVFMDHAQQDVTGTVRLKLYKGNVIVAGRRSPRSLYRQDVVTFEADSVYRQKDAEGFIRLNALRLRIRAYRDRAAPAFLIDVALTLEEAAATPLRGVTAIVLDVVRASTTIVTALANGARAVIPVATPEEARSRAQEWPPGEALIGGERGGAPPPGFDAGNSPAEYTPERVRGRTVVFTTTNGTRALLSLTAAGRIAVGGFVNATAVTRWAAAAGADVLLVCAGERGRFCLEDAVCAGLLAAQLGCADHGLSDATRAARALWERYRPDLGALLADATWAQALVRQGRGGDLPLCVALDAYDVVPVVRDGALVAADRDSTPFSGERDNEAVRGALGGDA